MYRRPHHRLIDRVLQGMNRGLLEDSSCLFGGGTCIALQINEFRESRDIDFLCSDPAGYRNLRQEVFVHGLKRMFSPGVELLREPRADQYGVRAVLSINGQPIKFEIVREGRIAVEGELVEGLPVPCLSRNDLYTEKLLANADRWADKSVMSRDIIDLAMMIHHWGALPEAALQKAQEAYGETVMRSFENATKHLRERPERLKQCIRELAIDDEAAGQLQKHFKPLKRSLGLER